MIEVKNIKKSYGDRVVLNNVNLQFQKNNITVLLGKSGEGKTTLFRIIAGIEAQDEGQVVIDNSKTTMVFQDNQLYPHLNVFNNLVLPQRVILKRNKKEATIVSESILKRLNIEYLKYSTVESLSGGEAQRVAIARALAMDKEIILFDEPTSALDRENTANLIGLLKNLKLDKTVLIITHDEEFSIGVADTIYRIECGEIKKA
jgi:polar amino acid transport system ATP-binding protein